MSRSPVIGVSACVKPVSGEEMPFHAAPEPYLLAVAQCAGGLPLMIPALGEALDVNDIAGRLDGLLLTGSKSNVHPVHYGAPPGRSGILHDRDRDATTLPLILACIERKIPVFAICRGFQELNVAFGGALYQHVHEEPNKMDHRANPTTTLNEQFGPAHPVALVPDGVLARLLGRSSAMVNSLHGQGISRLAPGLTIEATAPDGLIEAVRVDLCASFAIGVQWHPEWNWRTDTLSSSLFRMFGDDARAHMNRR